MKLPRLPCEKCGRPTAAGPVAGRTSKGRMWRHDAPGQARTPGNALMSCLGSLEIVDMPQFGRQLELDEATDPDTTQPQPEGDPLGTVPLFEADSLI
ncbi:hypothetical protein [Streptomyces microflavus]